ncbi:MAG: hypothetical protein LC667_18120 [Thioalkalivibrio sp.]|nr:hypothetical protein [Thioalkalivibrio sp.]
MSTGKDTIAFASILSGAYASAAVALLFLGIDAMRGDPFFTPSLMGSVALLGSEPSAALPVRIDMVAYYSLMHVVLFSLLGTVFTLACIRYATLAKRPVIFAGVILGALTLGMIGLDLAWFPGLVQAIGPVPLVAANLGAAVVMSVFIARTLAQDANRGEEPDAAKAVAPAA